MLAPGGFNKHSVQNIYMNYYSINLEDHPKTSWAIHEVTKRLPKRPRPEGLPPVFYKFFPAADVELRMKPQYHHLCCKKCGRYDSDKIFETGFDDPVTIRFKGEYGFTNDRIFTVSDRFLKVLKQARVGGFETKPMGKSGWHALRATLLVDHADGVVKNRKPLCPECQRPKESFGIFSYLSELSLPDQPNTFFSTKSSWQASNFRDRELFISEAALLALRKGRIVGGYCTRLWTDEERKKQKLKAKEGIPFWRPPKTSVCLNGKLLK